jgi:hypothetical protein
MKFSKRLAYAHLVVLASCTPMATSQNGVSASTAGSMHAVPGDTVWVISNHVQAARRADFQNFVDTVWQAGSRSSDPSLANGFRHAHVFYPTEPDQDGTYNYVFLIDPVLKGVDYDLPRTVGRLFNADEANRLMRLFSESLATRQQTTHAVVEHY